MATDATETDNDELINVTQNDLWVLGLFWSLNTHEDAAQQSSNNDHGLTELIIDNEPTKRTKKQRKKDKVDLDLISIPRPFHYAPAKINQTHKPNRRGTQAQPQKQERKRRLSIINGRLVHKEHQEVEEPDDVISEECDLVSSHSGYMVLAKRSTGSLFVLFPNDMREKSVINRGTRCRAQRHAIRALTDIYATSLGTFAVTGAGELVQVGDVPCPAQKQSPLFRIPRPVPELREWRIKQVAAGKDFVIVLALGGLVFTWGGSNKYGQLGHEIPWLVRAKQKIQEEEKERVRIAKEEKTERRGKGKATAKPTNSIQDEATLRKEDEEKWKTPHMVEALSGCKVENVSAGWWHAAAVGLTRKKRHLGSAHDKRNPERVLFTWGHAGDGRLGHSMNWNRWSDSTDRKIVFPGLKFDEKTKKRVYHGYENVTDESNEPYEPQPRIIQSLRVDDDNERGSSPKVIKQIAMGEAHTLALVNGGVVMSWGQATYGQLGSHNVVSTSIPTQVIGIANVVSVAAGPRTSYAVHTSGAMYSWGLNAHGELGVGDCHVRLAVEPVTELMGKYKVQNVECGDGDFVLVQAKANANCEGELGNEFSKELSASGLVVGDGGNSIFRPINTDTPRSDISDEDVNASINGDGDGTDKSPEGLAKATYMMGLAGPLLSSGQYTWKVRVSSLESGDAPLGIGVAWAAGENRSNLVTREPDLGGTLLYMQSQEKSTLYSRQDYGEYYREGDEITVFVDLDKGAVSFSRNGKDLGVCFNGVEASVEGPICLCIALPGEEDGVALEKISDTGPIVDEDTLVCFNSGGAARTTGMEVFYKCGPCNGLVCRACARSCHRWHRCTLTINYDAAHQACICDPEECKVKNSVL